MAESLRRLVNIGSFSILQEKLERWLDEYHINSCDQNVAKCCEVVELNARVQGQLFKLLSLCSSEGGMYGGAGAIKSRLLPWLGQGFFAAGGSVTADTSLSVLAESAEKDREINDLQDQFERSVTRLEDDLNVHQVENEDLRAELADTQEELDRTKRSSTSDKMFTDAEIRDLRNKLAIAEDRIQILTIELGSVDSYKRQIINLQDEIARLSNLRRHLKHFNGYTDSDLTESLRSYRYAARTESPLSPNDVTQRIRQESLVSRFNDMFSSDRLSAMDTLRRYSDDHENNQRIVFAAIYEAFNTAKTSFSSFKSKVRSNLAITHIGPETLEEAVQDYINRNNDPVDMALMISDVIRALNRNLKFTLPDAYAMETFIREALKMAWQMYSLAHPLHIDIATDAELFDDHRYRRSYESEYTAPLVNHHIWPCLMQGARVLVKGEAVTKRGASLGSPRRSRSPTRSLSPSRIYSSPRPRSRSPSPRRIGSPLDLSSSFSGRSSPGMRSSSRASLRSLSPSRPFTASTTLSHY